MRRSSGAFQPVMVDQPSVEDTISILRGLKEKYEAHHGVRIKDAALVAAATMSNRYITDRFLPDKAIDLVDEAAAKLRTEIDSMPQELDEVSRRVMQLEIEREALRKEDDGASRRRLGTARKRAGDAARRADQAARALGRRKERRRQAARNCASRSSRRRSQIEQAERQYDLNRVAELRYGTLAQLQKELARRRGARCAGDGARLSKEEVDEDDIAGVISRWTGIPVTKLLEGEKAEAAPSRGRAAQARHRSGRGRRRRCGSGAAFALRSCRSESPDRFVHLPRSDRRRKDRAGARARRVSVRRRTRA